MNAVFQSKIRDGMIEVPMHLLTAFPGPVIVTLDTSEVADIKEDEKNREAAAFFQSLIGTVPPFEPLTREEANDRYY